nr:MAG TPA: hypothetical protein [Caudoviricetes sp.]
MTVSQLLITYIHTDREFEIPLSVYVTYYQSNCDF